MLVLFGGILLGTFVFLWRKTRPVKETYELVSPQRDTVRQYVVATGKVEPRDEVLIKPQISGIVSEVLREAGQKVRRGDVIAVVKVVPELGELNAAESRVKVAGLSLDQTRREHERNSSLHEGGIITSEEFERSRTELDKAEEELRAAEDNLEIVRSGITARSAELSNTQIRSTVDGMILDVPVKAGNSVIQSNTFNDGTTIAAVADMGDMIFRGNVDETDVGRLHEGMPVELTIGALQDVRLAAVLEYISPKATDENGVVMFEVKAAVRDDGGRFVRAGYSANAAIMVASREGVLTIPESTVQFEDGKPYVMRLAGDPDAGGQTFEKQSVETGLSDGLKIEVLSGVAEGDSLRGALKPKNS